MTKHLHLTFSALVCSLTVFAQPVIQSSDVAYTAGDNFSINACAWQSAGSADANQTWDFSSLVSQNEVTIQMIDPSTAATGSQSPGATVAAYV